MKALISDERKLVRAKINALIAHGEAHLRARPASPARNGVVEVYI